MQTMNVAHFNTVMTGGAAIAARRLHDQLVRRGVESRFYVRDGALPNSSYQYFRPRCRGVAKRLNDFIGRRLGGLWSARHLDGRPDGLERFSTLRDFKPDQPRLPDPLPDVIHLHWIAAFFDLGRFLAQVPAAHPIVWTLHDMNPFTGGCHYAWHCRRFEDRCGACFQLSRPGARDASTRTHQRKRTLLETRNLHVVADSHWLAKEARASSMFASAQRIETIHYGVDIDVFKPRDRDSCRRALGLDLDRPVVCFGADSIENQRKGFSVLIDALEHLRDTKVQLVVFGAGRVDRQLAAHTLRHCHVVSSPDVLAAIYSAADLFVIPSLQEAFGQTALEAMACGVPVVGCRRGGIPDMVEDGVTGRLVEPGDAAELSKTIRELIDHTDSLASMGSTARRRVEAEFTLDKQASLYESLYTEIAR